jgi:hypothetical protein
MPPVSGKSLYAPLRAAGYLILKRKIGYQTLARRE